MGGMSAARADRSDTRDTIQPMSLGKRTQNRGRPHTAAVYRERTRVERFLSAETQSHSRYPV